MDGRSVHQHALAARALAARQRDARARRHTRACAPGISRRRRICCGCANSRRRWSTTRARGSFFLRIRRSCSAAACCTSGSLRPSLQAAAESVTESNRTSADVGSARGELVRAERFFATRWCIGRTTSKRGSATGACSTTSGGTKRPCEELRRAIADGASGQLLYLAQLFLGRAEEALGIDEAARAAFERAVGALSECAVAAACAEPDCAARGQPRGRAARASRACAAA